MEQQQHQYISIINNNRFGFGLITFTILSIFVANEQIQCGNSFSASSSSFHRKKQTTRRWNNNNNNNNNGDDVNQEEKYDDDNEDYYYSDFDSSSSATFYSNTAQPSIHERLSLDNNKNNEAFIDSFFATTSSTSFSPIQLAGQGRIRISSSTNTETKKIVLFLTPTSSATYLNSASSSIASSTASSSASLIVPLLSKNELKLISFAAAKRKLSKSVLLGLNTILMNRDNTLFDNLPWATWSVDPQQRNFDAANNPILEKFHLGKRDAYNRFMGKDWQGRSVSIGNIALRLKYLIEEVEESIEWQQEDDDGMVQDKEEKESSRSLAIRLAQLQIRELNMDLAGIESNIVTTTIDEQQQQYKKEQTIVKQRIEQIKNDLERLLSTAKDEKFETSSPGENLFSIVIELLDKVALWSTNEGKNVAPYRGAMGYAPMLDTQLDIEQSFLPYSSPFDLLKEILDDQLNAKVIGCTIENTSLLKGNTVLGGAIVLQRNTNTVTKDIMGETIEYKDYEGKELGNQNLKGDDTIVVECDIDEVIGISLVYDIPIRIENSLFERGSIMAQPTAQQQKEITTTSTTKTKHIIEFLPMWKAVENIVIQVEGQKQQEQQETPSPISIPRTTSNFYDSVVSNEESGDAKKSSSLFPTDEPIKSLEEYSVLNNEDKAKILLEISNLSPDTKKLPRPRVVMQETKKNNKNPLDVLLLPLIDESIRYEYNLQDAEKRGDTELVKILQTQKKSTKSMLKEKANNARMAGNYDLAEELEYEVQLLEATRADNTQDEGSYDRFLDKDEWYERDMQAIAKRNKKSSFGTLLDGIE